MIFRFLSRFWPSMIVVAVIAYATIAENPPVPDDMPVIPHIDKLIHAIMFGGLAGAVMFDIRRSGMVLAKGTVVTVCLGCAVAGAADELAQAFLTVRRAGDVWDWVADCVGIAVAAFTAPSAIRAVLARCRRKR